MVKIDEGIRKLVDAKIQGGASQRDVGKELGICQSSVRKIWKKFLNTGAVSDISRSGIGKGSQTLGHSSKESTIS